MRRVTIRGNYVMIRLADDVRGCLTWGEAEGLFQELKTAMDMPEGEVSAEPWAVGQARQSFGARLHAARERLGLTREGLALKANESLAPANRVTRHVVKHLETGTTRGSIQQRDALMIAAGGRGESALVKL